MSIYFALIFDSFLIEFDIFIFTLSPDTKNTQTINKYINK